MTAVAMLAWIASQLITLFLIVLFVTVIASWLIAFGIVNPSNQFVRAVLKASYAVTEPVLAPIRRVMPNLGGLDISPILVFIGFRAIQLYLLNPIAYRSGLGF